MPCSRPFQPISCSYKASKWSLRGSLLIETKCYGIDLFRESCSPYIKAIRACLLNTSEICGIGWSPPAWYKFTADLSTTAITLLFHLKASLAWPCTHPPHPLHACTHTHTCRPPTDLWQQTVKKWAKSLAHSSCTHPHPKSSPLAFACIHLSPFKHNRAF